MMTDGDADRRRCIARITFRRERASYVTRSDSTRQRCGGGGGSAIRIPAAIDQRQTSATQLLLLLLLLPPHPESSLQLRGCARSLARRKLVSPSVRPAHSHANRCGISPRVLLFPFGLPRCRTANVLGNENRNAIKSISKNVTKTRSRSKNASASIYVRTHGRTDIPKT